MHTYSIYASVAQNVNRNFSKVKIISGDITVALAVSHYTAIKINSTIKSYLQNPIDHITAMCFRGSGYSCTYTILHQLWGAQLAP